MVQDRIVPIRKPARPDPASSPARFYFFMAEHITGARPLDSALKRARALLALDQGYEPNIVRVSYPSQGGLNTFLLFPTYSEFAFWRASVDYNQTEVHRVIPDSHRCLHLDVEMPLSVPRERYEEMVWRLRCCVFSLCWRYLVHPDGRPFSNQDQSHFIEAVCEREPDAPGQDRHSTHLNFPQVVFPDNRAEYRFMHALYKSAEAVRAALPDMALYRSRTGASHSLRMARCIKLNKPQSLLVTRNHHHALHYHDPCWIQGNYDDSPNRVVLGRELFDPLPDEGRLDRPVALGPARQPRVVPVPEVVQDYVRRLWPGREFHLCRDGLLTSTFVGPSLPNVIFRAKPDFSYFALLMLMLSYGRCCFEGFYELVRRLRPDSASSTEERLKKYRLRYESCLRHYVPQHRGSVLKRIAKFLPGGEDQLPLFCPFTPAATTTCRLSFLVHHNEKSGRFFVHCLGCQRMRQMGTETSVPRTTYFCSRYVSDHLGLGRLAGEARSTLVLNAGMGLGKTHWLRDELRFSEPKTVLSVTVRVVLAHCFEERFGGHLYSSTGGRYFEWYETQEQEDKPAWMAIQLESLKRYGESFRKHSKPLPTLDVLVLDEFWSLMAQVASSTMDRRHRECVDVLLCLMRLATHVVVLDADAHAEGVPYDMIAETRTDHAIDVLYNTHLPVPLKKYSFMDYEALVEQLYQRVFAGHVVGICSGSLLEATALREVLRQRLQFDSQGMRDHEILSFSSQSTEDDMSTLRDADDLWPGKTVCFTPTVTVGFDFNPEDVGEEEREIYILCSSATAGPSTMLQMAGRFRQSLRVYLCMLPASVTAVRNLRPCTVHEVLGSCEANTARYKRIVQETAGGQYDEHGYFQVDNTDPLCRIAGWCKAERNSAMRNYVTALRLLLLQHGEPFEDMRVLPEVANARPPVLAEVLTETRWNEWRVECDSYEQAQAKREEVYTLYDFPAPPIPLAGSECAFLARTRVPNTLFQCWERLGGPEGLFHEDQALALYQADLAGHGHYTGFNDNAHPLASYHFTDQATGRPVAFNQFLAHTVCWVARLLQPFVREARNNRYVPGDELLRQHYGTAFFHDHYLKPLATPENAPLLELVGLTKTQLEKPIGRANALNCMLRKCLGLFNMTTLSRRVRYLGRTCTAYTLDWQRYDALRELIRGHSVYPYELLPLGLACPVREGIIL